MNGELLDLQLKLSDLPKGIAEITFGTTVPQWKVEAADSNVTRIGNSLHEFALTLLAAHHTKLNVVEGIGVEEEQGTGSVVEKKVLRLRFPQEKIIGVFWDPDKVFCISYFY